MSKGAFALELGLGRSKSAPNLVIWREIHSFLIGILPDYAAIPSPTPTRSGITVKAEVLSLPEVVLVIYGRSGADY